MTETPSSATEPTTPVASAAPRYIQDDQRSNRLYQVLAWVGIIAGTVFIVAVIFFSGFVAGRAVDGPTGWRDGYSDHQMGPGMPAHGGMMGPGQTATTTPPSFTQRP